MRDRPRRRSNQYNINIIKIKQYPIVNQQTEALYFYLRTNQHDSEYLNTEYLVIGIQIVFGRILLYFTHSLSICGDACPLSCVSAEACLIGWPNARGRRDGGS